MLRRSAALDTTRPRLSAPVASGPVRRGRVAIRPPWHQVAGWFLVFVGLGVAALNGLMYMDRSLRLLPGGFSLLYVPAGLPVAAAGAWLLGLFDQGDTTYR